VSYLQGYKGCRKPADKWGDRRNLITGVGTSVCGLPQAHRQIALTDPQINILSRIEERLDQLQAQIDHSNAARKIKEANCEETKTRVTDPELNISQISQGQISVKDSSN